MKTIAIKKPLKLGSPAGGEMGFVTVDAEDGQHELKFSHETAEDLILALRQAKKAIQDERKKAGKPPIETLVVKKVVQLEYSVDLLNEIALIRTRFEDQSTQELPIERSQIPDIARFLNDAMKSFESQSGQAPQ